jgi:hypothetical protein
MSYCVYYDLDDDHCRVVNPDTKQLITIRKTDKIPHSFTLLSVSGLTSCDEDLIKYIDVFDKWCDELKHNKIYEFDYKYCYCDNGAVTLFFHKLAKKTGYLDHDTVDIVEKSWMDKTYNSGVIYGTEYTGKTYGYDYIMSYPNCMNSPNFKIPTKRGKEKTIKKIPEKLKYGYYRVKITCDNPDFLKVFAFSQNDVYIHYSVDFALKHAEMFNVKLELIIDDKPNAYFYSSSDLICSKNIFGKWFSTLKDLKAQFPKNGLIKHLASSLYGYLKVKHVIYKTVEEIESEKLDVGLGVPHKYTMIDDVTHDDGSEEIVLVETNNVYKSPLARIQPAIAGFIRNKVAYFSIRNDISKIVRVFIDNVCFTQERDISRIPDLKMESKTTGFIQFKNAARYINYNEPNMTTINKHDALKEMYNEGKIKYKSEIKKMAKELDKLK